LYAPHGDYSNDQLLLQNFSSEVHFDQVWRQTRKGRKKMSVKWLKRLEIEYPKLYSRALELNKLDGFEMANGNSNNQAESSAKQQ
jgi:histone arginine demethylase JMJD6